MVNIFTSQYMNAKCVSYISQPMTPSNQKSIWQTLLVLALLGKYGGEDCESCGPVKRLFFRILNFVALKQIIFF